MRLPARGQGHPIFPNAKNSAKLFKTLTFTEHTSNHFFPSKVYRKSFDREAIIVKNIRKLQNCYEQSLCEEEYTKVCAHLSKKRVKIKVRDVCFICQVWGMHSSLKTLMKFPQKSLESAPVHLPRAKLGPLHLAFLRNPRFCNMFIFLSLFLAAKQVKNFISSN